jgi:DNA-binding beta-propeller fold protein YncE
LSATNRNFEINDSLSPPPPALRAAYVCLLACVLALVSACGGSGGGGTPVSSRAPIPRTVLVGIDPQDAALDPATHTLYVVNSPHTGQGSVSVLDVATCNAHATSGCRRAFPTVSVGGSPGNVAVDQATDTIYVTNADDNTVSVIDGASCNAVVTTGCNRTPPTVAVGGQPVDVAVDEATDTVYVANWDNGAGTTVSVIDGATCNARVTSGCRRRPASVTVGRGPAGVIVDQATDTVYTGTVASSGAEAVSVIDGAACNARITSGCGRKPTSVRVGTGSTDNNVAFAVDPAVDTLYVANWQDNTLSMIDEATCNATVTSGCTRAPEVVHVGKGPVGIALDIASGHIYVANAGDDTVTGLDAATCNANVRSRCGTGASPRLRTGNGPRSIALDPATDTVYVPNGDDDTVSLFNGAG